MQRAPPSRRRRRRRMQRALVVAAGLALGASCRYWPPDVAWVCMALSSFAEAFHVG